MTAESSASVGLLQYCAFDCNLFGGQKRAMADETRAYMDVVRILDRDGGRGRIAEQVRIDRSTRACKSATRYVIVNPMPRHRAPVPR
jgi:hypothetical protein